MTKNTLEQLHDFIAELLSRRREIHGITDEDFSLVYGEALLNNAIVRPQLCGFPRQIAVIGPTQAGKSTVVNLLLDRQEAQVSSLAGCTRHLHGFCDKAITPNQKLVIEKLLPNIQRVEAETLSAMDSDCFSLSSVTTSPISKNNNPWVIWDTPDFDSTTSRVYRSLVPALCALADLVLLVVSKEKYADLSVWQTLRLLTQIKRPLLICINKCTEDSRKQLLRVMEEKLTLEGIVFSGLCALNYQPGSQETRLISNSDAAPIRYHAALLSRRENENCNTIAIKNLLKRYWPEWTEALHREHLAAQTWARQVEKMFAEADSLYQRNYQHTPQYRETMQRTVAKLLELLEIPGLAELLVRTRKIITWPFRKLMGITRYRTANNNDTPDRESEVLRDTADYILLHLQRFIGDEIGGNRQPDQNWWQELRTALDVITPKLDTTTSFDISIYQKEFAPEIESAAQSLYSHLQQNPTKLNSLRAARVTADAAAVVLALNTGGIGLSDLILAPAMLSVTTMLMEGSVGRYMQSVEESLKQRQLLAIRHQVWEPLKTSLLGLPRAMNSNHFYGFSSKKINDAEKALAQL